jgi:molybdopterin-containing oxidoreductase family iron-sulfur binding subunit
MDNKRRTFLKFAGVAAAVGAGSAVPGPLRAAYAPEQEQYRQDKDALTAKRWGLVIDTRKFTSDKDIERCIEACHSVHNVPEQPLPKPKQEIKWIWTDHFEHVFPSSHNPYLAERVEHTDFLLLCNHCDDPPCVRVCPTKATFQREDGIVHMDFHRCIGCRYCMAGCPFGARSFNFCDPVPYIKEKNEDFPTRMRGVVEKCNFCVERLEEGLLPACVEAAPEGAMVFGDLSDPNSQIRKVLREEFSIRRKVELGTNPSVFYIV